MYVFTTLSILSLRVRSIKSNWKYVRVLYAVHISVAVLCCFFGFASVMPSHNDKTIYLMSNFHSLQSLVKFMIVIKLCA